MAFSWLTSAFCFLCVFVLLWQMIRTARSQLLHLGAIALLLSNGVSIPFMIDADPVQAFFLTEDSVIRACEAILIFLGVVVAFLFLPVYRKTPVQLPKLDVQMSRLLLGLICLVGIGACFRFFVLGRSYTFIGKVFQGASDVTSYYENRANIFEDLLELKGRGIYGVVIAMNVVFPVAMAASAYLARIYRKEYWAVFAVSAICPLVIASVFGHRAMFITTTVLPLCLFIVARAQVGRPDQLRKTLWLILCAGIAAFFLISGTVFMLSNRVSLWDGMLASIERLIGIPSGTSSYYYVAFPEIFPFRGFAKSFRMFGELMTENDVSFEDVSQAVQGSRFGANACFLAIAYSGAGFYGVLAASFAFCGLCSLVDRTISKLPPKLRLLALVCSGPGLTGVMNLPLLDCLTTYGFATTTLIIAAIFWKKSFGDAQAAQSQA